jgi:hypothetical protein
MSGVGGKFEVSKKGRYEMDTNLEVKTCPMCPNLIPSNEHAGQYAGALSRRDNKTEICSDCGRREAIEDFLGMETCPNCWEVITEKNPMISENYTAGGVCQDCYDPTPQHQWEVTERW